jgi:CheY-like chemotaxis protein
MTRRTSHEVNNELASIIINLSLASSARVTDDDRREHIRDALKAARGAAETAKRLTALATDWDSPDAAGTEDAAAEDLAAAQAAGAAATATAGVTATAAATETASANASAAPQADVDEASDATDAADLPVERVGSLLILDDDAIVKNVLTNYLSGCGFEVESTTESIRCIEMYRDAFNAGTAYDLVILDLRIGQAGMGGMETLTALQTIDPHVRAIAHSGYSTDDVMLNPTRFGFVASIKKPTPPSEIARALTDLIRVHGADA